MLNIAGYRFVPIDDASALRQRVFDTAQAAGLRGTVLLAEEGINLSLAGPADAVRGFLHWLRSDARFADLTVQESRSAEVPFARLRVKCKPEIIRMGRPAIRPVAGRAPAVDATTLRRWLDAGHDDAGRPLALLDTRNAFEVDHGTFAGALDWRLSRFTEFPPAAAARRAELHGKTVVTFCTGGIRCEKAALALQADGVANVLQLDGGILRYFRDTDGAHFTGRCFVFDEREALDTHLRHAIE